MPNPAPSPAFLNPKPPKPIPTLPPELRVSDDRSQAWLEKQSLTSLRKLCRYLGLYWEKEHTKPELIEVILTHRPGEARPYECCSVWR